MVNWKTVCSPKKFGGLGIKDLTMFGRALRLRWPWFAWDSAERPWKGMAIPCDEIDLQLFAACTKISVGNGQLARFWKDRWLNGVAPAEMAPLLFRLTKRKSLSVAEALSNGCWLRGLSRISSEEELHQFLQLWVLVDHVQLLDQPNTIWWQYSSSGVYSASSAYDVQFTGRLLQPHLENVWKAKVEGKVKFFLWLWLRNRNWTADRLSSRGIACNPTCCLCDQEPESAAHLLINCSFSKEVWATIAPSNASLANACSQATSVRSWWAKVNLCTPKAQRVETVVLACYTLWNVWKERGRRIFEGKAMNVAVLVQHIREEVKQVQTALLL